MGAGSGTESVVLPPPLDLRDGQRAAPDSKLPPSPSPGPRSQWANNKHTQRALVILLLGRREGAEIEDTRRKLYKIKMGRVAGGGRW